MLNSNNVSYKIMKKIQLFFYKRFLCYYEESLSIVLFRLHFYFHKDYPIHNLNKRQHNFIIYFKYLFM